MPNGRSCTGTAEIIEFKVALARSGMNQSEAMEAAIALWVKQQGGNA